MESLIGLFTLIILEIVLGIDNIIFISIVAGRLPVEQQAKARRVGLLLAMFIRLGLLGIISLILKLEGDLFQFMGKGISGKDLILILGGIFLLYKSVTEIHHRLEGDEEGDGSKVKAVTFAGVIAQILLLDLVFSIDSIITAIGMVRELWMMYVAVVVAVVIMMIAAAPISNFITKHPSFKILALAFLLLIGFTLIIEGLDYHVPKGYVYFAMAFSLLVDLLQMRMTKKSKPVKMHDSMNV